MAGAALYVYAIVPDADAPSFGPIGIDDQPVSAVALPDAAVAAIVHEGPPIPYQGTDDDVRRWVLEHSRVVEHAWEIFGTVLPVTFNVIVKGDDTSSAEQRLRTWLQHSATQLRERLAALRDHVELRVEISLDRDAASRDAPDVQALRRDMDNKPAGMRRLLERKLEQVEKDAVAQIADRLYPDIHRRIAAITEDLNENRRPRPEPGHEAVFSAAILTTRDNIETVGAELARIQAEIPAARVRFLGPWPCYSFADVSGL
jgi:hypothetical protein